MLYFNSNTYEINIGGSIVVYESVTFTSVLPYLFESQARSMDNFCVMASFMVMICLPASQPVECWKHFGVSFPPWALKGLRPIQHFVLQMDPCSYRAEQFYNKALLQLTTHKLARSQNLAKLRGFTRMLFGGRDH